VFRSDTARKQFLVRKQSDRSNAGQQIGPVRVQIARVREPTGHPDDGNCGVNEGLIRTHTANLCSVPPAYEYRPREMSLGRTHSPSAPLSSLLASGAPFPRDTIGVTNVQTLKVFRERSHGRRLVQPLDANLRRQRVAQARGDTNPQQRVAAEFEEAVI